MTPNRQIFFVLWDLLFPTANIVFRTEHSIMERKRDAFTLVELLVVISIIALLLSILMPALSKVREQARTVICKSRMSQWGQFVFLYAHDNADSLPHTASGDQADHYFWFDKLGRYISEKRTNEEEGHGSNYDLEARKCPAMTNDNPIYIGVNSTGVPGCAPFIWEIDPWTPTAGIGGRNQSIKLSVIIQPGSLFGFLDVRTHFIHSPLYKYFRLTADYDHDGMDDSIFKVANNPEFLSYNGARPRTHSDGATLWMFDGHTEYIKFKDFWKSDKSGYPTHPFWNFRMGK